MLTPCINLKPKRPKICNFVRKIRKKYFFIDPSKNKPIFSTELFFERIDANLQGQNHIFQKQLFLGVYMPRITNISIKNHFDSKLKSLNV